MIAPKTTHALGYPFWPVHEVKPGWSARVELQGDQIVLLGVPNPLPVEHAEAVADAITAAVIWHEEFGSHE